MPVVLFSAAIFAGAFLLFLVQPMVGKRILPWFGGGPGVWTVCLMFYQATLFGGYLYAHGLVRFLSPKAQWGVHAFVLALAVWLLPVLPSDLWRPDGTADPGAAILILLFMNVFAPFLALAATGPLLQAWFARAYADRSPYPLYAVSNTGSFVALFLFPAILEPFLPLMRGGELWSWGYMAAALLILASGALGLRKNRRTGAGSDPPAPDDARIRRKADPWLWIGLSACAVILLMAMTNKLCMDVASVPFLWVLPLGLYLLSFIVCFSSERAYNRSLWICAALLAILAHYSISTWMAGGTTVASQVLNALPVQVLLLSLILFSLCMLLHGELYRLRPSADSLTSFYLAISGGGALGGLFVGAVAVRIFSDYHELATGYLLALALILFALARDPESRLSWRGPRWRIALASVFALALAGYFLAENLREPAGLIYKERNFFGVARVQELQGQRADSHRRVLRHGTTVHGVQLLDQKTRGQPIGYYGPITGIGMALGQLSKASPYPMGVLGLGAGSLAAYGRAGDAFRFYEIDPVVIRAASQDGYFTYLEESPADIEVVAGDARMSLQRELASLGSQKFEVLVVDCFSSDAIPIHLITKESLELYVDHLAPQGLLAFHISNRYFDLEPILYRLAAELGLAALTIENKSAGIRLGWLSRWVFLSPSSGRIAALRAFAENQKRSSERNAARINVRSLPMQRFERAPLWTDDYSSLLGLLFQRRK